MKYGTSSSQKCFPARQTACPHILQLSSLRLLIMILITEGDGKNGSHGLILSPPCITLFNQQFVIIQK